MASSSKRKSKGTTPERKKTRVEKEEEEEIEGFKFSRRSRRAKVSGGRSEKRASKSAKRRRSSFVRGRKGRKSLQPLKPGKSEADIFKDISDDLPQEAKIRKVFDASLQLALEKISEGDDMTSTSPSFREQAKKVLQELRNVISDSVIVEEAFIARKKCIPDSDKELKTTNAAIEQDASNSQQIIERLKSEEEKWEDLLRQYQEKHDHMLQESVANNNLDEPPDFLSPEQHQLLSGKPNMRGIMDKMTILQQKAMLEVDEIAKVVQSLKEFTEVSAAFVERKVTSFGVSSRKRVEDVGTPKTLIRGILGRK